MFERARVATVGVYFPLRPWESLANHFVTALASWRIQALLLAPFAYRPRAVPVALAHSAALAAT